MFSFVVSLVFHLCMVLRKRDWLKPPVPMSGSISMHQYGVKITQASCWRNMVSQFLETLLENPSHWKNKKLLKLRVVDSPFQNQWTIPKWMNGAWRLLKIFCWFWCKFRPLLVPLPTINKNDLKKRWRQFFLLKTLGRGSKVVPPAMCHHLLPQLWLTHVHTGGIGITCQISQTIQKHEELVGSLGMSALETLFVASQGRLRVAAFQQSTLLGAWRPWLWQNHGLDEIGANNNGKKNRKTCSIPYIYIYYTVYRFKCNFPCSFHVSTCYHAVPNSIETGFSKTIYDQTEASSQSAAPLVCSAHDALQQCTRFCGLDLVERNIQNHWIWDDLGSVFVHLKRCKKKTSWLLDVTGCTSDIFHLAASFFSESALGSFNSVSWGVMAAAAEAGCIREMGGIGFWWFCFQQVVHVKHPFLQGFLPSIWLAQRLAPCWW